MISYSSRGLVHLKKELFSLHNREWERTQHLEHEQVSSDGVISYLKQLSAVLSWMKHNAYNNEQNTQAPLFSCKPYNFGASETNFYHLFLYVQDGLERVNFMTCKTIKINTMALDTWNFSWFTIVIVQQILVVYRANFL